MRLKYCEVEGSCFVDDIMILTIALIPLFMLLLPSVVYLVMGKSWPDSMPGRVVSRHGQSVKQGLVWHYNLQPRSTDYACFALHPGEHSHFTLVNNW